MRGRPSGLPAVRLRVVPVGLGPARPGGVQRGRARVPQKARLRLARRGRRGCGGRRRSARSGLSEPALRGSGRAQAGVTVSETHAVAI